MISNLDGRIKRVNELMIESVIEPDLKEAINNLLNLIDESSNRYHINAYWLAIRSIGRELWPHDRVWLKSFKT